MGRHRLGLLASGIGVGMGVGRWGGVWDGRGALGRKRDAVGWVWGVGEVACAKRALGSFGMGGSETHAGEADGQPASQLASRQAGSRGRIVEATMREIP